MNAVVIAGGSDRPVERGGVGRTAQRTLAPLLMAAALLIAKPLAARAATITGASIKRAGNAVELRFALRGRGLAWHLSAHGQELWIDLENVRMQLPSLPLRGQEIAPVTGVRAIYGGGVTGRIAVEVKGRADYVVGQLPHELILRIASVGEVHNLADPVLAQMRSGRGVAPSPSIAAQSRSSRAAGQDAATYAGGGRAPPPIHESDSIVESTDREYPGAAPAKIAASGLNSPAAPSEGRHLVVIDPGHGGYDPGTEAAGDVAEKDLALQLARRLRDALAAGGIDARLTREGDTFLALAERTQLANRQRADLFVSIHLNSSPDANTAGIETYYLNNTTDRATIRLAHMENDVAGGYSAPAEPNLNYILTDLRQQDKANESASLARMIEAETIADVGVSMGIRLNDLGAKQGPFYVLIGALMPSVLVECGFLSNPEEARRLQSPAYQQALAGGIARAVMHYLNADAAVGNL